MEKRTDYTWKLFGGRKNEIKSRKIVGRYHTPRYDRRYINKTIKINMSTVEVEPKSGMCKAVARGDLVSVQQIVDAAATISSEEKNRVINYARKWTEHNMAYESEENPHAVAEWYDVTPITLAAMRGHDAIVEFLLQQGADPTLKGCSLDDLIMGLTNDENLTMVDLPELHMNAFDAANKLTNKIRCCRRTRDLLMVVKV